MAEEISRSNSAVVKMETMTMKQQLLELFFLEASSQVECNLCGVRGTHSSWTLVKSGVPRRIIIFMGPILFIMYVNDSEVIPRWYQAVQGDH